MTYREKLIELLDVAFLDSDDNYCMPNSKQVADHLLDNGVVVLPHREKDMVEVVRCKNCIRRFDDCPMYTYECGIDEFGEEYAYEKDLTRDDGYCDWGERYKRY